MYYRKRVDGLILAARTSSGKTYSQKTKLRILYISQAFPPEVGAAAARAHEMAKELVRLGNYITVITGFPRYHMHDIPAQYKGKIFYKETIDGINVIRTYVSSDDKSSTLKRLLNYFSFMFSSTIRGIFLPRCDVVLATSPPLFSAASGYILCKIHRARFVFEVRDLWVDFAQALNQLHNKALVRLSRKLEMFLCKKADKIITVTDGYKDYISRHYSIAHDKLDVVTNGVDTEKYKPFEDDGGLREKYGLKDKFIVLFAGNIGLAQGMDVVIDAADMLKDNDNIVFMLVGEGAEKERLRNKVQQLGLHNVIFEDTQPRDMIIGYHNMADVSLVCLKRFDLFNITLPSKIFDTLAMGKPILIGVDGEGRSIVENARAGLFFEPENASDLKEKVLQLYNSKELCVELGRNARACATTQYERRLLAIRLNDIINEVYRNGRGSHINE